MNSFPGFGSVFKPCKRRYFKVVLMTQMTQRGHFKACTRRSSRDVSITCLIDRQRGTTVDSMWATDIIDISWGSSSWPWWPLWISSPGVFTATCSAIPVTTRKDDAPAADQAATTSVVGWMVFSGGGGLIQTTSC